MHDYRYTYGDRPLEGYTIQRAAGKGGFGEVYYAVSDSGRQVALKTVQNHEQIELRGIKQCMNLKSPHLVTIFDVKYNDRGQPFVIMEFVSGISLRDLLDENPSGIGAQKAAFFLREIAKGLSYLHECGIVHRDLKPANIFYENGYVKIGDYGLTKAISTSQHSGQTITVGTVHYMAPEIGEGKYDCSIDIYALGILLYEMLTGQVPFFGASPAEILMKHMKAEPELGGVEEPFARVIRKALAKDPNERYRTVQEMVEDIFGTEHIRQSVSQFSPESLSMVAERVAQKAETAQAASPTPARGKTELTELGEKIGRRLGEAGDRLAEKMAQAGSHAKQAVAYEDSINRNQRRILGLITMVLLSIGIGLIGNSGEGFTSFFMMMGATLGISIARWRLLPEAEPGSWRNWLCGGLGILVAVLVSGGAGARRPSAMILPLLLLCFNDWWKLTANDRKERIDWGPAITTGVGGFFLTMFFGGGVSPLLMAGIIVGTIISIQVISPFGRASQPSPGTGKPFSPQKSFHNLVERCRAQSFHWKDKLNHSRTADATPQPSPGHPARSSRRPVPGGLRILFMIGCMVFLGIGLSALIAAGCTMHGDDFTITVFTGVDCLLIALFCLFRACTRTLTSWYRYLIKPSLKLICLMIVVASSICLGSMRLDNEEQALAIILIVLPSILYFVIWLIPCRVVEQLTGMQPEPATTGPSDTRSPHKSGWALVLSIFLPFIGIFGGHRFYVGKMGSGFLWLFTFGLLGIGQLVDVIMILAGRFRDAEGRLIRHWTAENARSAVETRDREPQAPFVEPREEVRESPLNANAAMAPEAQAVQSPPHRPSSHVSDFISVVDQLNPLGYLFAAFGTILLVVMLLTGIVGVLRIPWFVSAGIPDPSVNEELTRALGSSWPLLVDRLIHIVCVFFAIASATFFAIGRRRAGAMHIIRAVVGILLMLGALSFLNDMIPQHYYQDGRIVSMWQSGQTGPALEELMMHANDELFIPATCLFLASVVALAWPPRRTKLVTSTPVPTVQTD